MVSLSKTLQGNSLASSLLSLLPMTSEVGAAEEDASWLLLRAVSAWDVVK